MPKNFWFIGVLLVALLASGIGFVYTYNTGGFTFGIADPVGDIVTVTEAENQPDWNSLISENATIMGEVPAGDLYDIIPQSGYSGDLVVKAYLANTSALIKAYQYLNIKLYQDSSEEADDTPDYRLMTLENGSATFSLTATGFGLKSWSQQSDFEAGTLTNLDATTSPGNVKLAIAPLDAIASDGFESGGWSGGSGWLYPWWNEGSSNVIAVQAPYEGSYHVQLKGATGYIKRALDLSGQTDVRIQFWVKVNSFEEGDVASCQVSPDGINWTVIASGTDGNDDNIYHFYDVDLSGFSMTSEFWIAFDATTLSGPSDYFYIDDVRLVSGAPQYYTSGNLISEPASTSVGADYGLLTFTIAEPAGTDIKFQIRSAATSDGLAIADWYGPTGTGDYYTASGIAINPVHDDDRWIQYRAVFSGDGTDTPTLSDIAIAYNVSGGGGGKMLSVPGGSYHLVSDDSSEWAEGWSIVPEIYVEVVQR